MSTTSISKLKYQDILDLAEILDHNLSYKNWNSFGKLMIEEKTDILPSQIDFIKHGYVEEESASWEFIHGLPAKVACCSVTIFEKLARSLKRNDISQFLNTLEDQSIDIWKISTQEKKRLVYYLELPTVTSSDWRMFADELGYSHADIKRISNRTQLLERPTVLLLNLLTSKYPDFSLEELRDICMKASDSYSTLIQRIDHVCSNQGWTSNGV